MVHHHDPFGDNLFWLLTPFSSSPPLSLATTPSSCATELQASLGPPVPPNPSTPLCDRSVKLCHRPQSDCKLSALNVMYSSMNSPSQLTDWSSSGGNPCGDDWKGIKCSGSSVTEIKLSGLGLTGSMGYQLSSLTSVTEFDLSENNLHGDIPYQLPPNAVNINLAGNAFSGGVPYSISQMTDLKYLNLANNQLTGQLTDMFGNLRSLSELDLSFNRFSGDLPHSLGSVSKLNTLHLQNNQFTGSVDVIAALPLEDLNIENNRFTGWIPNQLKDIENIQIGGNPWSSGPAPPHHSPANRINSSRGKEQSVNGAAIAGIVIAVLFVAVILLGLIKRKSSSSSHVHFIDEDLSQNRSFTPLVSHEQGPLTQLQSVDSSSSIDIMGLQKSPSMDLKLPPSDGHKLFNDNDFSNKFHSKRSTDLITASPFSLVDLQAATGNFNVNCLLGEGSIGCVYKAKYADGKILAVKKINSTDFPRGDSKDFMKIVSGISRLHHPNISELVGFCSEPGYHLLVYEFERNGSIHDFLHLSDDYSKPLTWDTRVKIALGTARAVEYLHEVCSPSTIHKNIKSANILLDAELNPHLSDCGLASFYKDTSENLGPGYTAPECTKPSAYTLKSDVYSFGVVMLELLTGRKPFDSSKPRSEQSLVRWAAPQLHDIDALTHMVDPALRGLYPPKSLSRFADVVALCVQPESEFRPPMSEVVQALVRCVQRTSINKRLGGDLGASRRSVDSDYGGFY